MAKISTLIDDFSDNVINPSLWSTSGTVTETSGKLVLTPTATSVPSYAITNSFYDLSSSQIVVQIPGITADGFGGTLTSALYLSKDASNTLFIAKVSSQLQIGYVKAGVTNNLTFTPYNTTNHLYWRIRADSSNIYWETSPTGSGYFIQATTTIASVFAITALKPTFLTQYNSPEGLPGNFQIEAVNPGPALTFSGGSTSSGQLTLNRISGLAFSGASTSSGSLALTISASPIKQLTFSGASTSTGSLSFVTVQVGQLSFNGASNSSGSLSITCVHNLSFIAQSYATGSFSLATVRAVVDPLLIQYFIFEPPIQYDRPAVHSKTPRRVRSLLYYNAHSPGATGVSVLKLDGVYQSIYSPTVDQINAAEYAYQGGHVYTIPQSQADELAAAGYTVTPLPVPTPQITVYPEEDLYPSEDLFPGYHDTVLVTQ